MEGEGEREWRGMGLCVCMRVRVRVHVHVCVRVHVCVCVCVCMHVAAHHNSHTVHMYTLCKVNTTELHSCACISPTDDQPQA